MIIFLLYLLVVTYVYESPLWTCKFSRLRIYVYMFIFKIDFYALWYFFKKMSLGLELSLRFCNTFSFTSLRKHIFYFAVTFEIITCIYILQLTWFPYAKFQIYSNYSATLTSMYIFLMNECHIYKSW